MVKLIRYNNRVTREIFDISFGICDLMITGCPEARLRRNQTHSQIFNLKMCSPFPPLLNSDYSSRCNGSRSETLASKPGAATVPQEGLVPINPKPRDYGSYVTLNACLPNRHEVV